MRHMSYLRIVDQEVIQKADTAAFVIVSQKNHLPSYKNNFRSKIEPHEFKKTAVGIKDKPVDEASL